MRMTTRNRISTHQTSREMKAVEGRTPLIMEREMMTMIYMSTESAWRYSMKISSPLWMEVKKMMRTMTWLAATRCIIYS